MISWQRKNNSTPGPLETRVSQLEQRLSKQVAAATEKLETLGEMVHWLAALQATSDEKMQATRPVVPAQIDAGATSDLRASVLQGFGQIVQRMDRDLAALGQKVDATSSPSFSLRDSMLQGFGQIVQRMDNDLAALGQKIEMANGISTSLRESVLQGFGQVVQRMESDFATLAQTVQRLDRYLVTRAAGTHELSRTMAKELTKLSVQSARQSTRPRGQDHGGVESTIVNAAGELPINMVDGVVHLDFPEFVRREFPDDFDKAWAATQAIMNALPGSDLSPLEDRSPGLRDSDSGNYIRLSVIRLVRVGAALRRSGLSSGRILDFGSYYGNFSLFLRSLGFEVYAADTYGEYGGAFSKTLPL